MFDLIDAITTTAAITPKSMEVGQITQRSNYDRPSAGLELLKDFRGDVPAKISEGDVLRAQQELGKLTRAKELVTSLAALRRNSRQQALEIQKKALEDRKDAIGVDAQATKLNGEFARFIQGALFTDQKEEAFTLGYQLPRAQQVSVL
jgi:hypothetical protein